MSFIFRLILILAAQRLVGHNINASFTYTDLCNKICEAPWTELHARIY